MVGRNKKKILDEGHNIPYLVHQWGNKLYKDLKQTFWWRNMKQEVADYVATVSYTHLTLPTKRIV